MKTQNTCLSRIDHNMASVPQDDSDFKTEVPPESVTLLALLIITIEKVLRFIIL